MSIAKSQAYKSRAFRKDDWVTPKEVCEKLGISRKTLSNRVSAGRISHKNIMVGECGDKFFNLPALMGFDN